jgi:hypothetical protein
LCGWERVMGTMSTHALLLAIKDVEERGLLPAEVLADSLYGSEKNVAAASAVGREDWPTVPQLTHNTNKKSKSYQQNNAMTSLHWAQIKIRYRSYEPEHLVGLSPPERVSDGIPFTWISARLQSPPAALQPFANWNWGCIPSWFWREHRSSCRDSSHARLHPR